MSASSRLKAIAHQFSVIVSIIALESRGLECETDCSFAMHCLQPFFRTHFNSNLLHIFVGFLILPQLYTGGKVLC